MVFVLRCEQAPVRTLREIDESGTERAFWIFPDGRWLVAVAGPEGVDCAKSPGLDAELEEAGSVTIVAARRADELDSKSRDTIPAPAPGE